MIERLRAFLLRLLIDPPAADLPEMILPVPPPERPEEPVRLAAADGRPLRGLWVEADPPRRGAVVYVPPFEDRAESWRRHAAFLPPAGWCVLAVDPRGQGASPPEEGYRPRKWATDREVRDVVAAAAEARRRAGGAPALFGVSRGAAAAAAAAPAARAAALVLDSAVSIRAEATAKAPRFAAIYLGRRAARWLSPLYGAAVAWTLREAERREGLRFVEVERALAEARLPTLLIWGADDGLAAESRLEVAAAARGAQVWIVPAAGHNAATLVAPDEYRRRVIEILQRAAP